MCGRPEACEREPFDAARYAALLNGSPAATLFHTTHWADIVTGAFPQLTAAPCLLRIAGRSHALPLFRWRRLGGLLAMRHSSFPFLYGGPVPATREAWQVVIRYLAAARGAQVLIGNPFSDVTATDLEPAGLAASGDTTHLLQLPATAAEFWDGILTSRKRNDIRRLTRKGVVVEQSQAATDVDAVYELYLKRMRTWRQRPGLVYPLAFYRALCEHGRDAVRLYVVHHAESVIGGTFVCRWNGICHYLAGYFDHDAARLRPNVLAQERIIRDAIQDGYRIYDMLPSAGISAVEAFKESFGGRRVAFGRWERVGRIQNLARQIRARVRRGPA